MKKKSKTEQKWKGYLNYSLTKTDKKKILENRLGKEELLDWLESMANAGYSCSISSTTDGTGVKLTLTGRDFSRITGGYSVTSWGAVLWQCLSEMHYIFNSGVYGEELEGLIPMEGGDDWFLP